MKNVNDKTKWKTISKALKCTNGSPFAVEIIHTLYDQGLLKDAESEVVVSVYDTRKLLTEPQMLWVEALESGEYPKTLYSLEDDNGFCCLGVACKVYEKATGKKTHREKTPDGSLFEGHISGATLRMHGEVMDWLSLNEATGTYRVGEAGGSGNLSRDNDKHKDFLEIAKIIRSKPEGLFYE